MKATFFHRCLAVALASSALAGCFGSRTTQTTFVPQSAVRALTFGTLDRIKTEVNRPTSSLGIFASLYLSGHGFTKATSAPAGVVAQVKYHAKPSEEDTNTAYSLLEEFGIVLQVDIPDVLNRSDNRAETLNSYFTGLQNITERSRRRATVIQASIESLQLERKTRQRTVTDLDRVIRAALKDQDYSTAGSKQAELAQAQSQLTDTESQLDQQQTLLDSFENLLDVADRRLEAIDKNREILIAGLKAVDVPGAEDLGVIQQEAQKRRRSSIFGQ